MRKRIIKRLEELKAVSQNFSKQTMRWGNFNITVNNESFHISEMNWKLLDDEALMNVYERVIRRFFSQM
jgi:hypothetical protein